MKRFGRIEDRRGVDEPGYEPPAEAAEPAATSEPQAPEQAVSPVGKPPKPLYDIGQVATAATVIGGALMVIGSFLPLYEAGNAFARIAKNTIVQQEEWLIPIFGAIIALAAINSYVAKKRRTSLVVLTVLGVACVVILASNKNNRTLYHINSLGEAEGEGQVVPFAIAIYVVGAGAALAFLGSLAMWKAERIEGATTLDAVRPDHRATKQCPDCAETILSEAHVCKHCGYRFTGDVSSST